MPAPFLALVFANLLIFATCVFIPAFQLSTLQFRDQKQENKSLDYITKQLFLSGRDFFRLNKDPESKVIAVLELQSQAVVESGSLSCPVV